MAIENQEQVTEQQTNGAVIKAGDPVVELAVEREARDMGWVPEDEWKGNPPRGGFKSPEDFVQRGKEVLPIVNKRLKEENAALADKLTKLETETADKIERMGKMSRVALDRQREQIESKYEELKESAVEIGDKAAYRAADKAGKDALTEFDKAAEPEPAKESKGIEIPAGIKATVDGWIADNGWMKSDSEMNAVANARHERLLKEKPGLSLAQNLAEVRKYVEKKYPEKFGVDDEADDGEEPRPRVSRVEGGSREPGGGGGSKFAKLPKEVQAQADRFIKEDGLFLEKGETAEKNLPQARERYAREYGE